MIKPRAIIICSMLLFSGQVRAAETIDLDSLGQLQLSYVEATAADHAPGAPLSALASPRPGEVLSLVSPYRVRRMTYLVDPGERVSDGQPIAVLYGPEIHHFLRQYAVMAERLDTAQRRFERSRSLYQRQAIDDNLWVEISEHYYTLQLEYEHLRHFRELLQEPQQGQQGEDRDSVTLVSPATGILQYRQRPPGIEPGSELAQLIPAGALRLQVSIPAGRGAELEYLERGECKLEIDTVSSIANDFFVDAWTAPLEGDCAVLPGQRVEVTPWYSLSGYAVPRQAVFEGRQGPAVLIKDGSVLRQVPVQILGRSGAQYTVACDQDLAGREVLVDSVSAAQGLLMGLGGE